MWWLIWREVDGSEVKAYSFTQEPTNEDILSCSENGWDMAGYPVQAHDKETAIESALASED